MAGVLRFIAWASLFGALGDAALAIWALLLIGESGASFAVSVDSFLRAAVSWLYWIKALAAMVLPDAFVEWLFALPSLVYFPARVAINIALSGLLFALARRWVRA